MLIALMESSQPVNVKVELHPPQNNTCTSTLAQRRAFMCLPLKERRQILQRQAEEIYNHYQEDPEWQEIEVGDIVDY